ncbi:hypothetical protein [Protaetiibacter intestinalis]|uniref:PNPLA domain-containing protein n=1 Tax=Protaetiibacter intestinalis TaxID=2419774 RepID=A0A387BBJ9_9MICO|nr:hypothetical protein [Protaetiibacter intestinalis]AYF98475.1 hypothetical protein D7I47_09540 [Protaetiibacter intestinalis]
MSDAAAQRTAWGRRLRRGPFSSAALGVLGLAALLVIHELDRLIADVLTPSGRTHALSEVTGVGAFFETEAWGDWAGADFPVGALVVASIVADLVLVACYAVLLLRLVDHVTGADAAGRRVGRILVGALVAADLLEDALVVVLALLPAPPVWLAVLQAAASTLKFLAILVFAVFALLGRAMGAPARAALGRAWRGGYAQRLVAIAVGAIAAVSLISADGVLEQLPDAYRSWIGYDGLALGPMAATLFAFAATGTGLFWLARGRARRYDGSGHDARPPAPLAPWLLVAAVVAALGVALGIPQNRPADWVPLGAFLAVLVAIPLVSLWLRRRARHEPPPLRHADISDDAGTARRAGDVLLACWVALAGLGPFKAFVAPLALEAVGDYDHSRFAGSLAGTSALTAGYLVLAVVGAVLTRRATGRDRPAATGTGIRPTLEAAAQATAVSAEQQRMLDRLGIGVLAVSGAVVAAFLVWPMAISAVVGPAAVLVLLAGAWTGILGWLILALGHHRPLEVFQALRLRSAPVVTLLVVLPMVAALVQNAPSLHAVRFPVDRPLPDRPPLAEAYGDWYAGDSCTTEIGGVRVKPLVLVAAEGGGIRAATWTVDVLRELPRASDCAADAVFASTGASGGSIGLASFRTEGNARGGGAAQSTIDFGGDDALAADLAGLLAGDLVAGVSGIRVPSSGAPHTDEWAWRDRTGLQETTWESQAPQFAEPFDAEPVAPTGYLVLGSTDSASLCKVLVSQLDLTSGGWTQTDAGDGAQPAASPDCTARRSELAGTIDLLDYLGACEADLSWASAAELSARFPFVSPSGRISPATLPAGCRQVAELQLVDGGLTDNSAVGTWVDIAPALTALIRASNAGADGDERPYVLPVLLFATNEPGTDVLVAPDGTRPEALVPFAALLGAKGTQTSPAAWLRRASDAYQQVCPPSAPDCTAALVAWRGALPGGIVVASPSTSPAVSVPLGWSLSSFSRSRLRFEATGQALCGRDPTAVPAATLAAHAGEPCTASGEWGMLGELLDAFDDATPHPVS